MFEFLLVAVAAIAYLYKPKSVTQKRISQIDQVIPGLYISDMHAAYDKEKIKSLEIQQIITIGTELHSHADIPCLHIKIYDAPWEPISKYFSITNKFINKAPTLVHCRMGVSRSATIILAYLIYIGYSLDEALILLKRARPFVNPNHGFIDQLKKYNP